MCSSLLAERTQSLGAAKQQEESMATMAKQIQGLEAAGAMLKNAVNEQATRLRGTDPITRRWVGSPFPRNIVCLRPYLFGAEREITLEGEVA